MGSVCHILLLFVLRLCSFISFIFSPLSLSFGLCLSISQRPSPSLSRLVPSPLICSAWIHRVAASCLFGSSQACFSLFCGNHLWNYACSHEWLHRNDSRNERARTCGCLLCHVVRCYSCGQPKQRWSKRRIDCFCAAGGTVLAHDT